MSAPRLPHRYRAVDDGLYQLVGGVPTWIDTSGASDGDVVTWDPDLFGVGAGGYELRTPMAGGASAATAGALGAVEISGTPTDAAHPVVYTKEATDALVAGVTGGASLSAKYTIVDPLLPDASPDVLNDEHDATSIARYTKVYDADSGVIIDSNTTVPGALYINRPTSTYHATTLLDAIPAGDWSIYTRATLYADNGNAAFAGLVLSDAAVAGSGTQTRVCVRQGGGAMTWAVNGWDGFGSGAGNADIIIVGTVPSCLCLGMRRRTVAGTTTYYFGYSLDGAYYYWRAAALRGGITPTHFGRFVQTYNGNAAEAAFDYLRVYRNGTTLRTGALRTVYG